jgi:hypothetical protein
MPRASGGAPRRTPNSGSSTSTSSTFEGLEIPLENKNKAVRQSSHRLPSNPSELFSPSQLSSASLSDFASLPPIPDNEMSDAGLSSSPADSGGSQGSDSKATEGKKAERKARAPSAKKSQSSSSVSATSSQVSEHCADSHLGWFSLNEAK